MDPFATLGIDRRFDVDLGMLEKRHRELSRALHPDKYAAAGASERRAALAKAVEVNEAWRVVRDPIRRAEALFTLAGVAVGETREPKPDPDLLMEMMEQREALAEAKAARDAAKVHALARAIEARRDAAERSLSQGLAAADGDGTKLATLTRKLGELRYYRRFLEEAGDAEEELTAER